LKRSASKNSGAIFFFAPTRRNEVLREGTRAAAVGIFERRRLKETADLVGPKTLVYRTKANCLRICVRGPIAVVYPEGVCITPAPRKCWNASSREHLIGGKIVKEFCLCAIIRCRESTGPVNINSQPLSP